MKGGQCAKWEMPGRAPGQGRRAGFPASGGGFWPQMTSTGTGDRPVTLCDTLPSR